MSVSISYSEVKIMILGRDHHHPVPILSNTVPLASLVVLKRPQAFFDRSIAFLSVLTVRDGLKWSKLLLIIIFKNLKECFRAK